MMRDGRQWLFGFSIESDTPRALTGQAEADSYLILLSRATHGSPDKPGGEIPQTKRKVIHLHHEHTRTFSIGAVDSAIRDTFKL